jgi:hypothetical protein
LNDLWHGTKVPVATVTVKTVTVATYAAAGFRESDLEEGSAIYVVRYLLARLGLRTCVVHCVSGGSLAGRLDRGAFSRAGVPVEDVKEISLFAIYLDCPGRAARRAVPELNVGPIGSTD